MVLSEELSILESCCLRPIMKNSVLEELRVRRLIADIQEEICFRAVWRWEILGSKLRGWNEKKVEYRLRKGGGITLYPTAVLGTS